MTRKNKREIKRALTDLVDEVATEAFGCSPVVYDLGDKYVDAEGEPISTDEDGDPIPRGVAR